MPCVSHPAKNWRDLENSMVDLNPFRGNSCLMLAGLETSIFSCFTYFVILKSCTRCAVNLLIKHSTKWLFLFLFVFHLVWNSFSVFFFFLLNTVLRWGEKSSWLFQCYWCVLFLVLKLYLIWQFSVFLNSIIYAYCICITFSLWSQLDVSCSHVFHDSSRAFSVINHSLVFGS